MATIESTIENLSRCGRPTSAIMIEMTMEREGVTMTAAIRDQIRQAVAARERAAIEAIDRSRALRAKGPKSPRATAIRRNSLRRNSTSRPGKWCRRCGGPCADGSGFCGEC